MNLKRTRLSNNITQLEASQIVNVPLRTYIRYENEEKYKKTLKYEKMISILNDHFRIDEEHGVLTIDQIKKICNKVFDNYDIEFAYLFGSYAKGKQTGKSDIDIMVCTEVTGMKFYGLVEELRIALNKKVDLVRLKDIKTGSDFMGEILKVGIRIYG